MKANKQYHIKVLLISLTLSGRTLGLYPQTKRLESTCAGVQIVLLNSIHLNGRTVGFHRQTF